MSEGWLHKYVLPLLPFSLISPSPFFSLLCSSQPNASADHGHSKELPGDGCKKLLLLKLVVISHFHTISPSLSLDVYDVNFSIILFDPKGYFLFQVAGVPLHTQFSSQNESERDKAKIITYN